MVYPKTLALLSGGIDSTRAVRLILDQGIEMEALDYVTPFCTRNRTGKCEARRVAETLGIPSKTIALTEELSWVIGEAKYDHTAA